jgi:enoyl-CoA hydratase
VDILNEYENLLLKIEDGIGFVTINRPKALNALNAATMHELDCIFDGLAQDNEVKVVVITGNGEKSFVAGADITEMQSMSAIKGRTWAKMAQAVFNKIEFTKTSYCCCKWLCPWWWL